MRSETQTQCMGGDNTTFQVLSLYMSYLFDGFWVGLGSDGLRVGMRNGFFVFGALDGLRVGLRIGFLVLGVLEGRPVGFLIDGFFVGRRVGFFVLGIIGAKVPGALAMQAPALLDHCV